MSKKLTGQEIEDNSLEWKKLSQPRGQNLLVNSTFAMGLYGWLSDPGWTYINNQYGMFAYHGSVTTTERFLWQTIGTHDNIQYTLSGGYPDNHIDIYLNIRDANNTVLIRYDLVNGEANKKESVTFTTPVGARTLELNIRKRPASPIGGRVSDLKLERGSYKTPHTTEGDLAYLGCKETYYPTVLNGWSGPLTLDKIGSRISLFGEVIKLSPINTQAFELCVLPPEYRPASRRRGMAVLVVEGYVFEKAGKVSISATGSVTIEGGFVHPGTANMYLDIQLHYNL